MSLDLLDLAAQALGPLVEEVVFVGGASIELWISDRAAPPTRATDDVDVISTVSTRAGYYQLAERLRARGFTEASDSSVICRWNHRETGLISDVMLQEEEILGGKTNDRGVSAQAGSGRAPEMQSMSRLGHNLQ